jgi:hypothetical protein
MMTILAAFNDKAHHHLGKILLTRMPGAVCGGQEDRLLPAGQSPSRSFDAGHSEYRRSASLFHTVVITEPVINESQHRRRYSMEAE